MIRKFFLLATLAVAAGLSAQSSAPANQGNSNVAAPGTNIYVVGGGLYGTGVYVMPGGVTAAPGTAAGISLAGRAGISLNEPMQLGVQSTLAPSWPVYAYGGYASAPEAVAGEGASVATVNRDFVPSNSADAQPQASPISLGEVSAYYKANRPQNVRTYTNADAQRLAGAVTIRGVSASTNTEAPATPSTSPQPQPSRENPPVAATPPEIAPETPPAPAPATHERGNVLPATSTLLPLLGLLGLASGGIGLLLRSRILK
jgi:hypothetical protein